MRGRVKNKVKYTLFTVIMSILMAFVFGCQPILEFSSGKETGNDNPSNWSQENNEKNGENTGGENTARENTGGEDAGDDLDANNFYTANGIEKTSGVSVLSGEYIKGYSVNDVNIAFEEGSLDNENITYDSLLINGKIFGEKFYSNGTLSNLYFNGYTAQYTYDKGKIVEIMSGGVKFEYEYDESGRIEKIFRTRSNTSSRRLYIQYIYSDNYTFDNINLADPLIFFFLSEWRLLKNPFIAELRYPAEYPFAGGRVYSFSEEGNLTYYTDLEYEDSSAGIHFVPVKGLGQNRQITYSTPKSDPAQYTFGHSYSGNSYMTKRTVKDGDYKYNYSYEYIKDKMVAETCFDGKNSQGYDITYIFDNAFNRTGFVYNNETFYYVYDVFGNTEKIIDVNGNEVVKYTYDLFGNVEITGERNEDIGLYNSYTYRGLDDWYYDNNLNFYYIGHNKIFDVKSGSFIKGNSKPETFKDFIKDPVNKTIKNDKAESFKLSVKAPLSKETLIKEKIINVAGQNLSRQNLKSYSNVLVWDHSDFYASYNGVSGLMWENNKAGEKLSLGRADIYTAPNYTEAGGSYGSEIYILGNSDDLAYAQKKLFDLTDINSYVHVYTDSNDISGNRYYTYRGEISFAGHLIYLNKYVTYKSVANGIIEFSIKSKSSNYDKNLGNLYDFDLDSYVLYLDSIDNNNYIKPSDKAQDYENFSKEFMAKYNDGWGGCYVETTYETYYSEEAAAALKNNTGGKITYFGGYDLEELKKQMGDDFGFTSVNGKTVVTEAKKSKDEFDVGNFIADIAIGLGIIVVASTVIVMSGGTATPFACFLVTSASLTAISLAGGALAMGVNMIMSFKETGKVDVGNALNGFSDAFMITAAVSSIGALTTGAGACFVAGTEIKTSNGVKAIENISKGDLVLSYNEITKKTEYKAVEETFIRTTFEKINIKTEKDDIITTPEHPFYSGGKWVQAKDLRAGDRLQDVNGKTVIVEQIQHELLETPLTVYNFRVSDNHNYYVGNGILVHNANYGLSSALQLPSINFAASSGLSLSKVLLFADIAALTFVVSGSISIPVEEDSIMRSITDAERKPRTREWALLDYTANGGAMEDQGPWVHFIPATEINYKLVMDWSNRLNYAQAFAYLILLGVADTAGDYTMEVMSTALADGRVYHEVENTKKMIKGKNPKRVHLGVYAESPSHAMQLGVATGCGPIRDAYAPAPPRSLFYGDGDGYITAFLVATEKIPGYYHLRGPNDAFRIWTMYPAHMYMAHDGPDVRWLNPRRDPVTGLLPQDDDYIYDLKFLWTDDYIKYQQWLLREFEAEHFEWEWWSVY